MPGIHIPITSDSSNLIYETKKAISAMKELADNMKKLPDSVRGALDSPAEYVAFLKKNIQEGTKVLADLNEQLDALYNQQFEAALKGDTAEVARLGDEMDRTAENIQKVSEHIENCKDELRQFGEAEEDIEGLSISSRSLNDVIRILPAPLKGIAAGINNVTKAVKALMKTGLGVALGAVAAALAGISLWLDKTASGQAVVSKLTRAFNEWSEAIFNTSKRMRELENGIREGSMDQIATFMKLKAELAAAGNDVQKQVKVMAQTNNEFGTSLTSVAQTEKLYNEKADEFVEALKKRAKAAQLYKQALDKLFKADELKTEAEKPATTPFWDWIGNSADPAIAEAGKYFKKLALARKNAAKQMTLEEAQTLSEEGRQLLEESARLELESQFDLIKNGGGLDKDWEAYKAKRMKYTELVRQQNTELRRLIKDNEMEQSQLRIDIMKDNGEKEREQLRLNYEKEKESIERWYEDLREQKIQKAREQFEAVPTNEGKTFTYDYNSAQWNATEQEQELYQQKLRASWLVYFRDQRQLWDKEVEEYGTYWERRAAIVEKWEKKIAGLQTKEHKKNAQKQYDAELRNFEKQNSATYLRIFSDMQDSSAEMIRTTIELAENELEELARTGKATLEEYDVIKRRVEELKDLEYSKVNKTYGTSFADVKALQFKQTILAKKYEQAQEALTGYEKENGIQNTSELLVQFTGIDANTATSLAKQINGLSDEYNKLKNDSETAADALKEVEQELEATKKIAVSVLASGAIGDLADGLSELGVVGAEDVGDWAKAVSQMLASFAADPSGITAVISAASWLWSKFFNDLSGVVNRAKNLKAVADEIARAFTLLNLSIDDSKFDTIFGTDEMGKAKEAAKVYKQAGEEYQKALENVYKVNDNKYKKQDAKYLSAMLGKSYWNTRWMDVDASVLNKLAPEIFSEDGGIFDATKAQIWLDAQKDMSDGMREYIQTLIDIKKAQDDARESLEAYAASLLDNTAGDWASKMVDNFVETGSAITDMTEDMNNFARALAKSYIKSMLLEKVFGSKKEDILNALSKGNEEGVQDAIRLFNQAAQEASDLSPAIQAFLEGIRQYLGVLDNNTLQQATGGAFQTMSETTGTELNGRFTALQISGERILEEALRGNELLLNANGILDDIRDMNDESREYLEVISKNSTTVLAFGEKLDSIARNTSKL